MEKLLETIALEDASVPTVRDAIRRLLPPTASPSVVYLRDGMGRHFASANLEIGTLSDGSEVFYITLDTES